MAELYTPNKLTLGSLLAYTSPPIRVPDWQRCFSWKSDYVETFWLDLLLFSERYPDDVITEQEYFLGSMVLVESGDTRLLLDGQQRLATATILLSVIRDRMAEYNKDAATRLAQDYIDRQDDSTGEHTYRLTLNRYDRHFFRSEVQTCSTGTPVPTPTIESHALIRGARAYFAKVFADKYAELGGGRPAFEWSLRIVRTLTRHMSVVAVNSTDLSNAELVFETLNDRGIGLSTPDLLRSFLLRTSPESAREEIVECWKEVLGVSDGGKVEDFLRHYWLSHHGDIKTRRLYHEIKGTIEKDESDPLDFSRSLEQSAKTYVRIVNAHSECEEMAQLLVDIDRLNARVLYPAVLSALETLGDEAAVPFVRGLVALYVRHSLVGGLESTKLETATYGHAVSLRESDDFKTLLSIMADFAPSDDEFRARFSTAVISRTASARYLLEKLELAARATEEIDVAPPSRVHVEHIYPKSPSFPAWENHANVINRLGNLTLLSRRLNVSIKNAAFSEKRPAYSKSDLVLTRQLADLEEWNTKKVEERQQELAQSAVKVWHIAEE